MTAFGSPRDGTSHAGGMGRHGVGVGGAVIVHGVILLIWLASGPLMMKPSSAPVMVVDIDAPSRPEIPPIQPPSPALYRPRWTMTLPPVEIAQPAVETSPLVFDNAIADDGVVDTRDVYFNRLVRHLQRFIIYPPGSSRRGEHGKVDIRVTMTREGRVLAARIETASGFAALDKEGVALIRRAQPLPPPPPTLPGNPLVLILPVMFAEKPGVQTNQSAENPAR